MMADNSTSLQRAQSNLPQARPAGHSFAEVKVTGGNLMQGDFNTIHNHYHAHTSRANLSSDTEPSESDESVNSAARERFPTPKFIVPRCSAPYFTGRSLQLNQLQDYLCVLTDDDLTRRIVLLVGTGGAGKTQFCLKYAEAHQSEYVHQTLGTARY